jgi:hypothetical protein
MYAWIIGLTTMTQLVKMWVFSHKEPVGAIVGAVDPFAFLAL